ncbi:MAG: 4Fe-4S binding protein [Schwartzia sp.]|nr:4Fe-4S binding protein [Victivallales bacterium]MBP5200505.1 4Fe-4S binding protein [Schwartzia sp. (in: firmicutes)]
MKKSHWYNYLWIWSVIYFGMGFFHILFAWLGLISFFLPLIFAVGFGSKGFCNRYCDRGQLLRALGNQKGFSRRKDAPDWMKSKSFRYGFLAFFMAMFANMLYMTYRVYAGAAELRQVVTLFWSVPVPWSFAYAGGVEPWAAQFAFGFYSMMLTSAILGILTMLAYKPRSWCVYCPMGTMTQLICKIKAGTRKEEKTS